MVIVFFILFETELAFAGPDVTPPTLNPVSIASNNADITLARVGDTVTLSFTADENIMTPVVTIDGNAADAVLGGPTVWTATRVMQAGDNEMVVPFTIDYTDLAGNMGLQVTATTDASSVTFDETGPSLNPVSISSNNADPTWARVGDTITLSFTSNEDIMAPTVTIDGNAADAVLGGPTVWTATRVMQAGDTDAPIAFTINFSDLAGNAGTQVTATTDASSVRFDEVAPLVTSGTITAGNTARIVYAEPVISVMGDYTGLVLTPGGARAVTGHSGSTTTTITLNFGGAAASVNAVGTVDIGAGLTDLAGNPITPVVGQALADGQAPSLNPVSIASNNADPTLARVGDTVTLSFTSNENVMTPVVTIDGNAADAVLGGPTVWTATRVMQAGDTDTPIAFTIDFADLVGNVATQVTATTDASSVTFDEILPSLTSSEITSGNIVTVIYDEPVLTVLGDYSGLTIGNVPRNIVSLAFGNPSTVLLTFSPPTGLVDDTGGLTVGAGVTDRAGNPFAAPGGYLLFDGQRPQEGGNVEGSGKGSAPSFSSSNSASPVTMTPISINGKHFNFIQSGSLVPIGKLPVKEEISKDKKEVKPITNSIEVGQLTQLKFVTFTNRGPDHIQHVAIYTNMKGSSIKPGSDTVGIIFEKGKELKIIDDKNILSKAEIKVSGEGNRVEIEVNVVFQKDMPTSDLVLRMWDVKRFPLYAHIEDAWKVVGDQEMEGDSENEDTSTILNSKIPVTEIQKEETIIAIKKWAGFDVESLTDSQLLETIGIQGEQLPQWLKKPAKWMVNEQVSFDEFIAATIFLNNLSS